MTSNDKTYIHDKTAAHLPEHTDRTMTVLEQQFMTTVLLNINSGRALLTRRMTDYRNYRTTKIRSRGKTIRDGGYGVRRCSQQVGRGMVVTITVHGAAKATTRKRWRAGGFMGSSNRRRWGMGMGMVM